MLLGVAILAIGSAENTGVVATQAQTPDRLVLLVFDQMRPDYVDRFGLAQFSGAPGRQPPYWIEHLTQIGKLHTAYQDTSVKLWLADQSADNERAIVAGLTDISGMVDVYALRSTGTEWRYERAFSRRSALPAPARRWADRRHDELMQTMAAEGAPHLVGLLADGFGFGRIGDHGGAQERVQRIPMIIRIPGERGRARTDPFRLMDLDREVTRVMRLAPAR